MHKNGQKQCIHVGFYFMLFKISKLKKTNFGILEFSTVHIIFINGNRLENNYEEIIRLTNPRQVWMTAINI